MDPIRNSHIFHIPYSGSAARPADASYYISARSFRISSSFVAQLVANRTTVWSASFFSQILKLTSFLNSSSFLFSRTTNCWFVGESMWKP